ncbi:MAG TPA: GAF domain-containing protein [Candidatus Acidoferrum sp.]|nr:GAF domain-containing protein [Candidatus Acidoferrum sp.]
MWLVVALGIVYEGVLVFTPLLDPYRFRTPYAIPTFDTLFALVAIGIGYLCIERHRLRQDLESAALGVALWLTALLAVAHVAAQPDYPANPGVNPGTAPYYFLACFFAGLAGIGLAAHRGARRFELTDRGRFWISAGVFAFGLVLALTVPRVRPLLPSLVMPPGKFTPFTSWAAGLVLGAFAVWVFWAGRKRFFRRDGDPFASYLLLAAVLWTVGLMGLLTSGGYRYSIPWYLAGLSRPLGVGLIFVGLLREQVWLYREARARQRDLEGLHGAGQALVRSLDAREIVQTITTKAVEVLAADGAVLFRLDADSRTAGVVSRAGVISDRFVTGLALSVEREDAGPAATQRRLTWTSALSADDALAVPETVRARMRQDGLETAMAMPLVVQSGETFGILAVFFRGQREFRDADVELLSAFGAQASVAIENARAFEQLAVKATHDATLQDFGRRLLEATAESPILDDAARTARDLLGADCVGIFLFDPTSAELRLEAGVGWQPETVGRVTVTPSNQSFAGYTFVNKEVVQVEDLADETRFLIPLHLTAHGIRAGINVPLGVRDQPIGVLAASYRTPHRFSDEESRALTSLAHQTALALDKVRLYAELQRNLERLQETQAQLIQADKLKALGTLLSGMAHELNNPLSTVLLSAQLLKRRHALSDPVRAQLDVIEQECERAARIIRELLVFARRRPPERKRIDVNDVVRSALELQTPEFDLRGVRVVTDLVKVPAIQGDAHQLQQVLLNLFSNATHAMKGAPARVLTVRSREVDGTVAVDVDDTGPGIAAEHLTRVFDPFFTTKGVGEGTGLGLSLSIGIVEAHGGSMHVENRPEGGARVTLRLPASDEVETGETAPNPQAPSERRGHILLVEDETRLRAVLHEVLTGLGHTVDEAATGEAAMLSLDRRRYDVVLLDLKLPDIDGKVIWRWLHSRHPDTAARVMFMTGDTMSPETETFLKEAGCPVLNKPLAIDQVARMVGQFLARP